MKIPFVGGELFRVGGRMETDGRDEGFRNFTKAPKNVISFAEVFENLFPFPASNVNEFRIVGK